MSDLYLSRLRLKKDEGTVAAMAPLLLGNTKDPGSVRQAEHHLMWSLFASDPDRDRDFLWRQTDSGVFFLLSRDIPEDRHAIFDVSEPKMFRPGLSAGDRLIFSLRANPVVRRSTKGNGSETKKHDVVMDAIFRIPSGTRALYRYEAVIKQGQAWLRRQGDENGFAFDDDEVKVDHYQQYRIGRKGGRKYRPISFSSVDFEGILTVSNPDAFLKKLVSGFGGGKAFGCGLMLIRRPNTWLDLGEQ